MMSNFYEILIQSILILCAFYLGYILFFSKESSFRQNRFFLLFGILLSMFFHFVESSVPQNLQFQGFVELKSIDVLSTEYQNIDTGTQLSFVNIFRVIYFSGVFFFFSRFIHQLVKISWFYRNSKIHKKEFGKLVYTGKRHPVFSFLNLIFIGSESEKTGGLDVIIKHERVHVAQKHSIDLLLFELLAIVQWFNPIIWLYRKIIKENHEFLADKGVLESGFSVDNYQALLLRNFSSPNLVLANSFNHSLTFKRLLMMKKNNTSKNSTIKFLFVIPFIVISIYIVSCSKSEQAINEAFVENTDLQYNYPTENQNDIEKKEVIYESSLGEKEIFMVADEMPIYSGGEDALRKFIVNNVKYPGDAVKNGISGKVYVKFVIDETGQVGNVSLARGVSPLLDEEAQRVVKTIPPIWTPAKKNGQAVSVWYTVPIKFSLR